MWTVSPWAALQSRRVRNRWSLVWYVVLLLLATGPEPTRPIDPAEACAQWIAAYATAQGSEVSCAIEW